MTVQPERSGLRILTLHGEGLQGLALVSVIDELCSRLGGQKQSTRCPAPCEVFDVICGTGIGSFIAVLLGKYCLDTSRCKQVYMDFADFVEERQAARRSWQRNKLEEEDVHDFLEILVKGEGWSDTVGMPVSGNNPICQHVFVVQRRKHRGRRPMTEVFHTDTEKSPASRNEGTPTTAKVDHLPRLVAGSTSHPLEGWSHSQMAVGNRSGNQPPLHSIIPLVIDEMLSLHGKDIKIGSIVHVGPQNSEPNVSLDTANVLKSPIQWALDKTSPVKSVVVWPLKLSPKNLLSRENNTGVSPETDRRTSLRVTKARNRSLSLFQWPTPGMVVPMSNNGTVERGLHVRRVQEELERLIDASSGRHMFGFSTPMSSHGLGDMAELKETRINIKDMITFLDGTGLLTEAAKSLSRD